MLARNKTLLVLSAAAASCALSGARAGETSFELRYYTNSPGGAELAAGDYAAAIAAVSAAGSTVDPLWELIGATNLCVAYTMTAAFKEASKACDVAVGLARRIDAPAGRGIVRDSATARALSNRGVLRAVRGDAAGALSDLRAAGKSVDSSKSPARNLAHLETSRAYRERLALADGAAD